MFKETQTESMSISHSVSRLQHSKHSCLVELRSRGTATGAGPSEMLLGSWIWSGSECGSFVHTIRSRRPGRKSCSLVSFTVKSIQCRFAVYYAASSCRRGNYFPPGLSDQHCEDYCESLKNFGQVQACFINQAICHYQQTQRRR